MKQFDSSSIATRIITTLSASVSWSQMLDDSAITSLINAIAESEAESVRYMENLLSESKWKYAQNLSSFVTQAYYLGYTPQRRLSAIGSIYVSHDSQLSYLGSTLFTIADLQGVLSLYTGNDITIPVGTVFSTSNTPLIQLISTQTITYKAGMQYLNIPVIQGIQQYTSIKVLGNPFEEISISDPTIEDASNTTSSQFLTVSMTPSINALPIIVTRYEDIFLADNITYAYDIQVPIDLSATIIRFGDGNTGALLPTTSTVSIAYLSSLGYAGNINNKYSVNSIISNLGSTLYCSNLDSILGGAGSDTALSIQNKAPTAYVNNGGSIVSTQSYTKIIENLSYIYTAIVYSGLLSRQNTIFYSAVGTDGNDALITNSNFISDFEYAISGKNSPLDTTKYAKANFLHLRLGIGGYVSNSTFSDISSLETTIQSDIYARYGTLQQKFNSIYDNSSITSYINGAYSIQRMYSQLEAVVTLPPSTFISSSLQPGFYTTSFYFDPSYKSLFGFDVNHQYCLKINIIFTCAQCEANSRTLFLVPVANSTISYTCTVDPILFATQSTGTFNFSGFSFTVTPASSAPKDVISAIYTALMASNPVKAIYSIVQEPSSAVLNITPLSSTTGSSFISVTSGWGMGVGIPSAVQFSTVTSGNYQIMQYPYIPNITNNSLMVNSILSGNSAPYQITSTTTTDVASLLIPISVELDYSSLVPSDIDNIKLGFGTITIPQYLPNSSSAFYLNFPASNVDDNVIIEVVAQPIDTNIYPYSENNIVKLSQVVQNNISIDDVIIKLQST